MIARTSPFFTRLPMSTFCSARKPDALAYRSAASNGSTVPGWMQTRASPPGRGETISALTSGTDFGSSVAEAL
jgi:hypothetical protein